jgi:hypothetical protein
MTQKEFLDILKENKYFPDIKENAMYRFPVVKYYIENMLNLVVNGIPINKVIGTLLEPTTEEEYKLICYVFLILRQRYGYEK